MGLDDGDLDDKLDAMWRQQADFMRLLQEKRNFPQFPVDLGTKAGQRVIKDFAHDCMHELFEAIHLLKNSKSHRVTDMGQLDRDRFLEELADALHYFNEVCILAGITADELFDAYMTKGAINDDRIRTGY